MTTEAPSDFACGHVFFPEPDLYMAVNYSPRPGASDWVNVICEGSGEEKAIVVFLSPFDALLEAAYVSSPGMPYHVVPAYQFVPTAFISEHNGVLALSIHMGWPASDGALIMRRNGRLATCCAYQKKFIAPSEAQNIRFLLEQDTLDAFDSLYENAGLFAYKDTFGRVMKWPEERRHRAVATAIQRISAKVNSAADCNQIALYDPEFEQWHFVPRTLLDEIPSNSSQPT